MRKRISKVPSYRFIAESKYELWSGLKMALKKSECWMAVQGVNEKREYGKIEYLI